MAAGIEVKTTESETAGVPVVRVAGDIDLYSVPTLEAILRELLASGKRHIVLDLEGVPFVDSQGLATLVGANRRARELGGALHLTRVTPHVRRALEITRLIRFFRPYNSV